MLIFWAKPLHNVTNWDEPLQEMTNQQELLVDKTNQQKPSVVVWEQLDVLLRRISPNAGVSM